MRRPVAARLAEIRPSLTLRMDARARSLRASGQPIINLTAGQPDFQTPAHIIEAAAVAMRGGQTKYTDVAGTTELRSAVAAVTQARTGRPTRLDDVLVSAGVKHALNNVLWAVLDEGDEVIIPVPVWSTYAEQVRLAGGRPVEMRLSAATGYQVDAATLEAEVTPRTRAIILVSPANPTGAVLSPESLRGVARVAEQHDLLILSDEIYDRVVYAPSVCESIVTAAPGAASRSVVFNGVSKTYAMTGWRIGWAVGPREIIAAASRVQEQVSGNPSSVSQAAALAAITGPDEPLRRMVDAFAHRRRLALGEVTRWPDTTVRPPEGAFYLLPEVAWPEDAMTGAGWPAGSMGLAEYLLETARVAVVPGEAFSAPGHIRVSFAAEEKDVVTGLRRIGDVLAQLKTGDVTCRPMTTSA